MPQSSHTARGTAIEVETAVESKIELAEMARIARSNIVDPNRRSIVGTEGKPRFELFHAASSLCSQKVRTVLFETGLPYRSNDMLILSRMEGDKLVPAEHYDPSYVRLRMIAGKEIGREFVNGYSGRTSVASEGFDPCVVPLLIDHEAGRVIADSLRICLYLAEVAGTASTLLPTEEAARDETLRQASIVDKIPNGALLYGFHPDADRRPDPMKEMMATVYDLKVLVLEKMIAENAGDPELVEAYRAKIVKEKGGKAVSRDPDFQRASREHLGDLLRNLDADIVAGSLPFADGGSFTLADAFWGVNLVRVAYLGLASMWDGLPNVSRYFARLVQRPSLRQEAIEASRLSMPPSTNFDRLGAQLT